MKKTIAVLGLAAVSNAIHNNYVDDEYFGLGIDIKSKVQTADVSRSHGRIHVNMKDDADNELHNYFSMPHNKGDIQFNDYTVKGSKKDDADDEYFLGIKINNKVQTADVSHSHGMINVNMQDDADNELHNYYSMPHNKGNIQFNDYSKAKDDEFFGLGIDIKSKVQTADVSRSHGRINVNMKDDSDNELHSYYSMPHNKGNIQFNDYSKAKDDEFFGLGIDVKSKVQTANVSRSRGQINVNMKDDADDELFGLDIGIKSKVQTADVSRSHGRINVNMKDDADNELHNYFSMPHNKGDIQFNDYTVKGSKKDDADDELFLDFGIKSKVQTVNANHARGMININMKDDADNELHNYYSMPHNKGNIQFNDYSKTHDDEYFGLGIDIKSKVQTADVSRSHGRINVNMKDDADDELFGLGIDIKSKVQTADVSRSHGRINVNMKDDADDEFYSASTGKGNHKDEIELLRSLLKIATQDKNGNVLVDGVNIGKIPKAKEHVKYLKNNSSSKAQPELPKRKFLAF